MDKRMDSRRVRAALLRGVVPFVATVVGVACGGAAREPAPRAAASGGAKAGDVGPVASSSSSSAPIASASATAGLSACPADMLLVDGDYCLDLESKCLDSYHSEENHLDVCLEFAFPTKCVGDTKHMRYCIDKYEFPNREGQRPMVMQNFYQAQVHCAKRGKRVCTETEWTKACEGPENKPFPYGYKRDTSVCLGDRPWDHPDGEKVLNSDPTELERLWQGRVSGASPGCVSDYGVFDLPGNADELAASETTKPPTHIGKKTKEFGQDFDNVTTGGPWYTHVRNACRPKIYTHDESFAYYYLSWRCCAEPDGAPTDPRAPKQIKRDWPFSKVEDIANHSWKLPYNPHEPGDSK